MKVTKDVYFDMVTGIKAQATLELIKNYIMGQEYVSKGDLLILLGVDTNEKDKPVQ